ncbi:MAG: hypothetical protein LBP60_01690 [Spirochaetaceae bacterium]|jgi:hypothetical protein|nr:hypothetical protein [Spirochaetaceae bacterium]
MATHILFAPVKKLPWILALCGLLVACRERLQNNTPVSAVQVSVAGTGVPPEESLPLPYGWAKDGPDTWRIRSNPSWRDGSAAGSAGTPLPWSLLVYYKAGSARTGELSWKSAAAPKEQVFDFYPRPFEDRPLVFNSERWGPLPEEMILRAGEDFQLLSVQVEFRPSGGALVPLASDLGTMMYCPPSVWRNKEYEFFTFNVYPRLLYLVSESFAVQSRFLKRLAFFTEKPGFTGTLAKDEEIEGLRDWFAHDYRARDLARFFDLARSQNFPLNGNEILLRDMLLTQGIIRMEQGIIVPGEGALIGLSVESRNRLPVYYVHETVHGLEFTMPALHTLFLDYFDSLSSYEKDFIKTALIYREYNVERDQNLLIAETMAYLLQQRPEETDRYFREYIRPWYVGYHKLRSAARGEHTGSYTDGVLDFLAKNPEIFAMRSRALRERFRKLTGLEAETFFELLPKDRSL